MRIFVNGDQQVLDTEEATYESIVILAGYDPKRVLTVTYTTRRKGDEQREGSMRPGGKPLRVEENMAFDVGDTSNA